MKVRPMYFIKRHPCAQEWTQLTPLEFDSWLNSPPQLFPFVLKRTGPAAEFSLWGQVLFEYAPDAPAGAMPIVWHLVINDEVIMSRINTWNYESALISEIRCHVSMLKEKHPSLTIPGFEV